MATVTGHTMENLKVERGELREALKKDDFIDDFHVQVLISTLQDQGERLCNLDTNIKDAMYSYEKITTEEIKHELKEAKEYRSKHIHYRITCQRALEKKKEDIQSFSSEMREKETIQLTQNRLEEI